MPDTQGRIMNLPLRTASVVLMLALGTPGEATPLPKPRNTPAGNSFGLFVDSADFKSGDAVDVVFSDITSRGFVLYEVVARGADVVVVERERSSADRHPRYFVELRVSPEMMAALLEARKRGPLRLTHPGAVREPVAAPAWGVPIQPNFGGDW
jgi:hypothetical protein